MNPVSHLKASKEAGLFLFHPQRGEPSTAFALEYLRNQKLGSPQSSDYSVFISDEGTLYPPALQKRQISLSHFLLIQTDTAIQSWKAALEAVQTGLFRWVFLRPSQACDVTHLRKLQLESEKTNTSLFLFSHSKLPHWFFKKRLPVLETAHENKFITENLILSKSKTSSSFG